MLEQPRIPPDPMMEELHAIKDQIYEQTKDLSPEEHLAWIHAQTQEAAAFMGWDIVPDPAFPGVSRFVPRSDDTILPTPKDDSALV